MSPRFALAALLLVPSLALAGYSASSFKRESKLGANTWNAEAALDGKPETAWMIDPEDENGGQWIELDLPTSTIDKLAIVNGWDKSEDIFFDYPRLKTAKVEMF